VETAAINNNRTENKTYATKSNFTRRALSTYNTAEVVVW